MDSKFDEVIARYPELRFAYDELLDLIRKNGMPKLGRWVYCKYCFKNVLPHLSFVDGLVVCSKCSAGLAPLKDVIAAGSYNRWEQSLSTFYNIVTQFERPNAVE